MARRVPGNETNRSRGWSVAVEVILGREERLVLKRALEMCSMSCIFG